jgi:hypothetical protein
MKTLNDSLRGELKAILDSSDFKKLIEFDELEMDVLSKAFDVLLRFKTSPDLLEKARGEFENYIINHLKSLKTDI